VIKRDVAQKVKSLAKQFPVVMITGPRQSGKTTLCKHVFPQKPYVLLEDPDTREFATSDPRGFLARFPNGAVLDEIQKTPQLISYLQGIVDQSGKSGLFILTGSQNLLLTSKITQSLAGRTAIVKLLPFSFHEIQSNISTMGIDQLLLTGFYPRIYDKKLNPHQTMSFYFQTYVERDIRQIINIKDVLLFQKFVKLCAGRTGQLLNLSSLGNETGISHQTARDWLSLLEITFIVFRLSPYHRNFNKRIIKTPKIYFYDTGLASYLLGIENAHQMERDPLRGNLFENMIVAEAMKNRFNQVKESNFYFFRDNSGNEVDLIMSGAKGITAIEIKSGKTVVSDFFKGLDYFESIAKDTVEKRMIIYGGDQEQKRTKTHIMPFKKWA